MDYNTHSAHQLHRQRSAELARVAELRRRSDERQSLRDAPIATASEAPGDWWHRALIRWHLGPGIAH
jgi:hypothetical protein